jgi:tetratricopeptide (TPR) repeat protein
MADDFADVALAGITLYEKGRYEDALQKLKKAKRLSPADGRIDYNMGNINYQIGHFEEARKNWQNAIIKVDRSELRQKAYYNMANAFYREKRYQEAVQYYKKALRTNRKDYGTGFNLKLALHQLELQEKMKKEAGSKKSRQDRNERESGNDILEERKKSGKRDSNESSERLKEARAVSSRGFQEKNGKDSYKEELTLNAARRWLKTLKEGKYRYWSISGHLTNKSPSAKNDW